MSALEDTYFLQFIVHVRVLQNILYSETTHNTRTHSQSLHLSFTVGH